MQEQTYTGAIDDTRSEDLKRLDFQHAEVAGAPEVVWREVDPQADVKFNGYPIKNQDGSSSCVACTMTKLMGIENAREAGVYVELSHKDFYGRRANQGQTGMGADDAHRIARNFGATMEQFMPSMNQGEEAIAKVDRKPFMEEIGKVFRAKNTIYLPNDIDTIAAIIAQGKGVMIWVKFFMNEWKDIPQLYQLGTPPNHHSITGVDYIKYKGEKCIVIDDSWGPDTAHEGQRILTETFLKKRLTHASYLIDLENGTAPGVETLKYTGGQLKYGDFSEEVAQLQNCLRSAGFFPAGIPSTGRYLAITARAVLAFQLKYQVDNTAELNALQGMAVGPKTVEKLKQIFK